MRTSEISNKSPDFLAGQLFERERIMVVMNHKISTINPHFARTIIDMGFDSEMSKKVIDAAYLDHHRNQPGDQATRFVAAMKAIGNADISGVPSPDTGAEAKFL